LKGRAKFKHRYAVKTKTCPDCSGRDFSGKASSTFRSRLSRPHKLKLELWTD
jgi:hypothetical protein